jgi:hypothetical protein
MWQIIFFKVLTNLKPIINNEIIPRESIIMKITKKAVNLFLSILLVLSVFHPAYSAIRTQQIDRNLENIAILYLTVSKFFFKSGEKFFCEVYVENRDIKTLSNAKISLFIHKQGRKSVFPAAKISEAIIPAGKIVIFKFDIIWDETGYQSNYNYKHGDYQFETIVEHNNKTVSKTHVLWAKPHEYMFFWSKPF